TFHLTAFAAALAGAGLLAAALAARGEGLASHPGRTSNDVRRTTSASQRFAGRRASFIIPAAVAIVSVAGIALLPQWDHELLASGAYKYAPYIAGGDFDTVLRAGTLDYYKDGAAGTASVRRLTGTMSLAIDGKVDA